MGIMQAVNQSYHYSEEVGRGSGNSFSSYGEGRITAVRVWEIPNNYITGFQFQYDYIWSAVVGRKYGKHQEMELYDGEAIIQLSGKFHIRNYIRQVYFVTSRGRFLMSGQPQGASFNFHPTHPGSELIVVSGRRNNNGITSIGAHWGIVDTANSTST
ncbi:zymogen granule membrane protein 16-like [Polymixia lowei]